MRECLGKQSCDCFIYEDGWRLVDGLDPSFMQVKIATYLRKMEEAQISYLFAFLCSLPGSRFFKGAAVTQSKDVFLHSHKNTLHLLAWRMIMEAAKN